MAELVDALVSGTSEGYFVEVRVLFWAPCFNIDEALPMAQITTRPTDIIAAPFKAQ